MSNDKGLKIIAPSWDELFWDTVKLSEKILAQKYQADAIVAIARGGWIIGRLISDLLEQPNLINLRIEFYDSIGKTKNNPIIVQPITSNIKGLHVLIVDDVADTGITLLKAVQHVTELGASEVKTATVYCKPWARIKPDFYVKITDSWILFPHEIKESVKILYGKWHAMNLSTNEMINILVKAGMKKKVAKYFVNMVKSESSIKDVKIADYNF